MWLGAHTKMSLNAVFHAELSWSELWSTRSCILQCWPNRFGLCRRWHIDRCSWVNVPRAKQEVKFWRIRRGEEFHGPRLRPWSVNLVSRFILWQKRGTKHFAVVVWALAVGVTTTFTVPFGGVPNGFFAVWGAYLGSCVLFMNSHERFAHEDTRLVQDRCWRQRAS